MKFWHNERFHAIAEREEKPEPFEINCRYEKGFADWVEVTKEKYEKLFQIYYEEATKF